MLDTFQHVIRGRGVPIINFYNNIDRPTSSHLSLNVR